MPTDRETRQQIVQIVNDLFQSGNLTATGGNVSALSGDGEMIPDPWLQHISEYADFL